MPLGRAGSIPVIRISIIDTEADLAQLAERFTSNEEVAGSNPVVGIPCEYSSAGRTLPCHGRGRGFESRCSLCRLGGIGRRTGLKILRWRHRTGSIPVAGILFAPIAQLDRVSDYESEG